MAGFKSNIDYVGHQRVRQQGIEGVTRAALAVATGTSSGLLAKAATYSASTLSRAQGVLRKNLRLDLTDGLLLKQLILILRARYSQP